ncbi:unnamed protein product [Ophioblennius macclurei]
MSLSPVTGTGVPETPNGVVSPVALENGPHGPVSVNCGGGTLLDPAEDSSDGPFARTENHVDLENRVNDGKGHSDTEADVGGRMSALSLRGSQAEESSVPAAAAVSAGDAQSAPKDTDTCQTLETARHPDGPWDSARLGRAKESPRRGGAATGDRRLTEAEMLDESGDFQEEEEEEEDGEKEKQDEEDDEKDESKWRNQHAGKRAEAEPSRHYSSSAPGPSTSSSSSPPTPLLPSDDAPCPPHIMAQVWVRNVRGMQDSKSLDEISQACGGGSGARGGGRSGQSEGRRATISSALELEGTVSHEGDLTNFITKNLEQKIKMSSKPSLDCSDSDCSGPIYRSRGMSRRPADIPPIDPTVLLDLQKHTQEVAHSVEMMMRSLNGTIQNMTALSVGYIQTYRDSVDSLGESVDMSIKGMYTLMARCEELDRSMQPIHTLAAQIRDIKRTLDTLEAICK